MAHFNQIFSHASLMVKEYVELRPQDKLFFKYSTKKPNIIIEVVKAGNSRSDFLIGFNTNCPKTAQIALKKFYQYTTEVKGYGQPSWEKIELQMHTEKQL